MVDDKVYFSVQAWMVTKLKLRGAERDVFAIIYGYCQDGESDYHGSLAYMAELTGYSRNSICTALKSLTDKQLVLKEEKFVNNIKLVRYTINLYGIQATCTPVQATCTNNKQDNKTEIIKKSNSKELLQNSEFSFGKQKPKKDNLHMKCVGMIDDFISKHNAGNPVRNKLIAYLHFRLQVKDKPLYANMWKGMLNKLDDLHRQGYGYEPIIDYCLERGYLSFYPPAGCYDDRRSKPWEDGVSCEQYTEEELKELEALNKEREAKGLRTVF